MKKLNWFVIIGPNVYGQSKHSMKAALQFAVKEYGTERAKKDKARFKMLMVTEDFEICHVTGTVEASNIARVGWCNWSGTLLEELSK